MTGDSLIDPQWCEKCQVYHPLPAGECMRPPWEVGKPYKCTAVQYPKLSQVERAEMTDRYKMLMGQIGGQLAQADRPVPVRVYDGKPISVSPNTLALWIENNRTWAQYEETRALVGAQDIIELLLIMCKTGGLEIEA